MKLEDELKKEIMLLKKELEIKEKIIKEQRIRLDEINISKAWIVLEKLRKARRLLINPSLFFRWLSEKFVNHTIKNIIKKNFITEVRIHNELWPTDFPLVSVIINSDEKSNSFREMLVSLGNQTFQRFECITQNQDVFDIAKNVFKKNIVIKLNNNLKNKNDFVSQAAGKYIFFIDTSTVLDPTYLEKCVLILETDPQAGVVFSLAENIFNEIIHNQKKLYDNNFIGKNYIFKKEAWKIVDGFNIRVGESDWEFLLNIGKKGYFFRTIPEDLLKNSGTGGETKNGNAIRQIHKDYIYRINSIKRKRFFKKAFICYKTAFINLNSSKYYFTIFNNKKNIVILMPWMTFGGAETLVYNYTSQINDDFNFFFITGLLCKNEWEYKFKKVSSEVFHIPNLFLGNKLNLDYVCNFLKVRKVSVIHIIHNSFLFEILPEIKKRFPHIKVITTLFNDQAEHFDNAIKYSSNIDIFISDNKKVTAHLQARIEQKKKYKVIPNGVDVEKKFRLNKTDRDFQRKKLNVKDNEIAVFFIGRLSAEKKPDSFLEVASSLVKQDNNIKFFIVGDGPMTKEVINIISKVNNKRLTYLGYQSNVVPFLSAADIFVLPSVIEGFPLSILEAMSMEVVVIASDVGAIGEVIRDGVDGFVVAPANVSQIINKIKILIRNKELLQKIKSEGRKTVVNNYSIKLLAKNYKELYK